MSFTLFSKTDKRRKPRFFNPAGISSSEDSSASSGQDRTSAGNFSPLDAASNLSYRRIRLIRPKESLDDILEKLLWDAEHSNGETRSRCLEKMLHFLKNNPTLVNRVPNKFHSNPLELALQLGALTIAQELITLKAQVRPENHRLQKIAGALLRPNQTKEKPAVSRITPVRF